MLKCVRITTVVFFWIFWIVVPGISHALVITSPKDGETFKEGDTVKMVAELSPEDTKIFYVSFTATGGAGEYDCDEIKTHPHYECSFTIRPGSPSVIEIIADAPTGDGEVIDSQLIKIFVALPPTVTLQGLKTFRGHRLYFSKIGENKQLYIEGVYSDGVDRELRFAKTGTTYSSSDEEVITVNKDGLATARGVGTARITVKNGEHELTIKAEVDPPSKKKE